MNFGSAAAMATSLKNNNRRRKREAYDGWTESDKESQGIESEVVSEEMLEAIREKMKKQQKNAMIRNVIIWITAVLALAVFVWLTILYFENIPGIGWEPH